MGRGKRGRSEKVREEGKTDTTARYKMKKVGDEKGIEEKR